MAEPFNYQNPNQLEDIHDNERRFIHRDLAADFMDEMSNDDSNGDLPPPAPLSPDSNDSSQSNPRHNNSNYNDDAVDETFDTLDDFGEDTLHALMDSDLILGTVPPLSSLNSDNGASGDYGNDGRRDRGGFKEGVNESDDGADLKDELESNRIVEGSKGEDTDYRMKERKDSIHEEGIEVQLHPEFDFEDDNTASDSLLRGPLMAARSFVSMNSPSTAAAVNSVHSDKLNAGGHSNLNMPVNSNTVAMTPSAARAQFVNSVMKQKLTIDSNGEPKQTGINHAIDESIEMQEATKNNMTPSTARSTFLPAKKEGTKTRTPSNLIISTTKPPLFLPNVKSYNSNRDGITPSATREQFITSPQDSISTIGSAQSVDVHTKRRMIDGSEGDTPSNVRGGFVSPQGIGRMFTFGECVSDEMESLDDVKRIGGTPVNDGSGNGVNSVGTEASGGSKASVQPTPNSRSSDNTAKSSVGRLIALGEKQMKKQAASSTTAESTKKTFLKKGTRKEPSALHTVGAQLQKSTPAASTANNESASERKARLARLEKMQNDLRADYERREARKEEVQRERRRLRMEEIGSRGVVTKSVGRALEESAKKALESVAKKSSRDRARSVGRCDVTPSTARARSAVKSKNASLEKPKSKKVEVQGVALSPTAKSVVEQARRNVQNQTLTIQTDNEDGASVEEADVQPYAEEALIQDEHEPEEEAPKHKSKPETNQAKKTTAARRPRSVSRPKTAQTKPATGSLSPKRHAAKPSMDEKAFDEWKKKETEEWAMIKSMRRRQEAALREAEGERERAKAWATAERESTKKWVEEQRAIIKRDRHKASNAALLASKRAEKNKSVDEADAANAELEELRAQLTKLRMEAYEAKKLKEQVRKQEKTIAALKNRQGGTPKAVDKSAERRILGDRTSSETNKSTSVVKPKSPRNAQTPASKEKHPSQQPRKPLGIIVDTSNDYYVSEEEDTDVWLERNLNELNGVSNQLEQLNAAPAATEHSQRKPYNPADYGAPAETTTTSAHNQMAAASPTFSNLNGAPSGTPKSSQFFTYQNGTQKEVLSDGTTTVYFTNGDRKRTYSGDKSGIVVYYYAATQTTQVTHQDGKQTFHFPNKQIEDHHLDGTKEISYPDGTKRIIYTDGTTDTTFPDGVRVVDYPDGRQQVHQTVC